MELWTRNMARTCNENITIINKLMASVVCFHDKRKLVEKHCSQFLRGKTIRLPCFFSSATWHAKSSFYIPSYWNIATAMKWGWFGGLGSQTAHGTERTSKWCRKGELLRGKKCSGLREIERLRQMCLKCMFFCFSSQTTPTSRRIWNTRFVQDGQQLHIVSVAIRLVIFGARIYEYLRHSQGKESPTYW